MCWVELLASLDSEVKIGWEKERWTKYASFGLITIKLWLQVPGFQEGTQGAW